MNGKHHLSQVRKNWVIVVFILTVTFGAGGIYTVTRADFVKVETFELHVTAEGKFIEEKFKAQEKLIDQKFKNTDQKIEHLDEHLEEIKELLK